MVYGSYTDGSVDGGDGGIRMVYGWYTDGIRWYTAGIRTVYGGIRVALCHLLTFAVKQVRVTRGPASPSPWV